MVVIGSDCRYDLVDYIKSKLELLKLDYHDVTQSLPKEHLNWVSVAHKVGSIVSLRQAEFGILVCWSGTGVSIAANKIKGVRAVLVDDARTADCAIHWNYANVLCLSARQITNIMFDEIIASWLSATASENKLDTQVLQELLEHEDLIYK